MNHRKWWDVTPFLQLSESFFTFFNWICTQWYSKSSSDSVDCLIICFADFKAVWLDRFLVRNIGCSDSNRFLVRWNLHKWKWIWINCAYKNNWCQIVVYQFNICFINWNLVLEHLIKVESLSAAQMSIR